MPTEPKTKEIKVRIPMEQYLNLHRVKALQGTCIGDVVEEALTMWFAAHKKPVEVAVHESSPQG